MSQDKDKPCIDISELPTSTCLSFNGPDYGIDHFVHLSALMPMDWMVNYMTKDFLGSNKSTLLSASWMTWIGVDVP